MGKQIPTIPSVNSIRAHACSEGEAISYEHDHVHSVYTAIAPHFAATRYAPWPKVDAFLHALPSGSLVADVGCGNGKYMIVASNAPNNLFVVGTDRCEPLSHIAGKHTRALGRADAGVADVLFQPFRSGVFDAVVNIAVVHHLATTDRRIRAWKETVRLLRVGRRAILYVWALERPTVPEPRRGNNGKKMLSRRFEAQDMFVPWHMRHRKEGAESDKILGDTAEVFMRYYHVYTKGELEVELGQISHVRIVESYYDHQNWCAIVERTAI